MKNEQDKKKIDPAFTHWLRKRGEPMDEKTRDIAYEAYQHGLGVQRAKFISYGMGVASRVMNALTPSKLPPGGEPCEKSTKPS